jgi:hypothetical protein
MASMEGAVRSGHRAAAALVTQLGSERGLTNGKIESQRLLGTGER